MAWGAQAMSSTPTPDAQEDREQRSSRASASTDQIQQRPQDPWRQQSVERPPNLHQASAEAARVTEPPSPEALARLALLQLRQTHPIERRATAAICQRLGFQPPVDSSRADDSKAKEQKAKEQKAQAQELFATALALQQRHEALPSSRAQLESRKEGLAKSVALYRRTLELVPGSASTLHNLGRVYEAGDDLNTAESALRCAAAYASPDETGAYLHRLAEYLERQRRPAASAYGAAALALPGNDSAHQQALNIFVKERYIDGLLDYLWRLLKAQREDQSRDIALRWLIASGEVLPVHQKQAEALSALPFSPPSLAENQRAELLTLATAALGSRSLSPRRVLEDSVPPPSLELLARDEALGQSAQDLLAVLQDPSDAYQQRNFRWWRQIEYQHWPEGRGIPAAEAFRRFLSAVGRWYEGRDNNDLAIACYEAAGDLDPGDPDPRALRNLISVHARTGNREGLENVADRYAFGLFDGKDDAYASGDLERIYEYHSTLGQLYLKLAEEDPSLLGDPRRPEVRTAIFQLQRAYDTAKELDWTPDELPTQAQLEKFSYPFELSPQQYEVHLTPELAVATAKAYRQAGARYRAEEIIQESVQVFVRRGDDQELQRFDEQLAGWREN
ncbi:MAG: hypothetical protein AAGD01_09015 [Acidobacteriota bacterium]